MRSSRSSSNRLPELSVAHQLSRFIIVVICAMAVWSNPLLTLALTLRKIGADASLRRSANSTVSRKDIEGQEKPKKENNFRPNILSGDEAQATLDDARRKLFKNLGSKTEKPVNIIVDAESGAVLLLNLSYPLAKLSATSSEKAARMFLEEYQPLLDPRINPKEYVLSPTESGCDNTVLAFNRVVEGRPVLGSKLTLHLSRSGDIVSIVNGVAPASSSVAPSVQTDDSSAKVEKMLPKGMSPKELMTHPVLVPEISGGSGQLRQADLVMWGETSTAGKKEFRAVLVGTEGGVDTPFVVDDPSDLGQKSKKDVPEYHVSERTGVPDSISYRAIGGVMVEKLPADRNPAEIVYRFLDQHRSLYRTGAPRCQYGVKEISESALLPGVQFVRMEQRYIGLPVFGAELVFEIHGGQKVMSIGGHVLSEIYLNPNPRLGGSSAVNETRRNLLKAINVYAPEGAKKVMTQVIESANPAPELVVFPGEIVPKRKLNTRLAYKFMLGEFVYFIDANTGEEIYSFSTRTRQTINDGQTASEFGRLSYVTVHSGGLPTGALALNTDVLPLFASISSVSGFYGSLSWFGVNGRGGAFAANTNVGISSGCANAFFDPILTGEAFMCIGVGRQPDVVGHEFTHGVVAASSGLIYQDESGALNESYADLFGNLIFPDNPSPGATSSWLVGEPATAGGPSVGTGAIRDMQTPGNFIGNSLGISDPGTMGAYVSRSLPGSGCNLLPFSCDSGFVHSNSGIVNRAHVLLSDGVPGPTPGAPGTTPGIGRQKLATLAFLVMTRRLTPFARLIDAAVATRDMANTLALTGATARDGSVFTQADADQVPIAFGLVGLSPDLTTGWSNPAIGFTGTDPFFASGETTSTGCTVANITTELPSSSGILGSDLTPVTPIGTAVSFFGVYGIDFSPTPTSGTTPPPIGTTSKRHAISWFNIYGQKPPFTTNVITVSPPPGAVNCRTSPGPGSMPGSIPVERVSATVVRSGIFPAATTESIGNPASVMNPSCNLIRTEIELLNPSGAVIRGPANSIRDDVILFYFFGEPVTSPRGVTIIAPPPTGITSSSPRNLSAGISWFHGFVTESRFRLRYYIDQPPAVACTP